LRESHDVHCILHKLDASQNDGDGNTLILEAALAKYKVIRFLNCALLFWLFPMLPLSSLVSVNYFSAALWKERGGL